MINQKCHGHSSLGSAPTANQLTLYVRRMNVTFVSRAPRPKITPKTSHVVYFFVSFMIPNGNQMLMPAPIPPRLIAQALHQCGDNKM